jgi:hypothetical protein
MRSEKITKLNDEPDNLHHSTDIEVMNGIRRVELVRDEKCYKIGLESLNGSDHLGYRGVGGRIILK